MRIFVPILILCLWSVNLWGQSPWVRSKAGFYAQAAWHFIPAYPDKFESKKGMTPPLDRKLSEGTFQLYGEYGITKRTTAIASLPFRFFKAGNFLENTAMPQTAAGSLSGISNVSFALRHNLINKKFPLTLTLRIDTPVSRYEDATGLRTGYDAWTLLPMLSTGIGLGRAYGYVYGGYGYRSNQYSDFLNFGIEGGVKFRKAWLIGFSEWLQPLRNGDVQLPAHNLITSLYVNDQSYLSIGFKGIYQLNRFVGVLVSAAGVAEAELLPKSPGIGAGIFFKWE